MVEALAQEGALHPVQAAFVKHDDFQCGYCTPGQIMSAVACIEEGHAGSDAEIREWMSGNVCCRRTAGVSPTDVGARRKSAPIPGSPELVLPNRHRVMSPVESGSWEAWSSTV